MKLYTNIFTTLAVTIASFLGFVPSNQVDILTNRINALESNIQQPASEPLLGAYNVTGGGTYRLKSSAGLSDSTLNLSSFKEPVSNIPYTMSYLNTSIGYGTLEPQVPDRSEFISFTGITQNSDGSAQLTGVTRGINRSPGGSACTASTTLSIRHPAQSILIYTSDSPCHFGQYAVKQNDETITGYWSVPTPLSGGNVTSKTYVDGLVNGGAVSYNQIVAAGTAGETVSAGQVLYLKQSDGRWYKAATTIAEASTTPLAVAQGSGTSGNAITGGVLLSGLDSNQSGLTVGGRYFLGATAGTPSVSTSTRALGMARTTTSLYFDTHFMNDIFTRNGDVASTTSKVGISGTLLVVGTTTLSGTTSIDAILPNTRATTTMATTTIGSTYPNGLIGYAQQVGGFTTLSATFPPKDYLRIVYTASSTNDAQITLQFNNDTGASYFNYINQSTADTSINPFADRTGVLENQMVTLDIFNNPVERKIIIVRGVSAEGGAAGTLRATSTVASWNNATSSITSVKISNSSGPGTGGATLKVYADSIN